MTTLTVRIPDGLDAVLQKFCETDERSKSWFVKKALQTYLEDLEDYRIGVNALEEFEKGDRKTYSLDEVAAECGIELKSHTKSKKA